MKLNYKTILAVFAATALTVSLQAASSDQDKQFLTAYGKAHDALVADDLGGAKKAGSDLGPDGADLSKSKSLDEARAAFDKLSDKAVKRPPDRAATTSLIAQCSTKIGCKHRQPSPIRTAEKE